MPLQRPAQLAWPYLNPNSPLYQGLVFAGLGPHPGGWDFHDCSPYRNTGTLTNMDPATDWVWVPELGRWAREHIEANPNQHVALPSIDLGTTHTLSVWCRNIYDGHLCGAPNDAVGDSYLFPTTASAFTYRAQGWGATAYAGLTYPSGWMNLTVTRVPNAYELFINGVGQGSKSMTGTTRKFNLSVLGGSTVATWNGWSGGLGQEMAWSRVLSLPEISALADPSNAMLSVGNTPLILPPRRRLFAAAVAGVTARRFPWQIRRSRRMAGVR